MATIELQPTNGQKSFYGKALIIKDNVLNETFLKSYNTLILQIKNGVTNAMVHPSVEDIVKDAIKEFEIDMSKHYGDWEFLDVSARCYVLGSCISEIKNEYK